MYKTKYERSLSSSSTCSKWIQYSINFIFRHFHSNHPSCHLFVSLLWRHSAGLYHPVLIHWFVESVFFPCLFYLLFGANTSSANFLRKVAGAVKTLKPSMPENIISSFSYLIYVHWVYNSSWELFPFNIFKVFRFQWFFFFQLSMIFSFLIWCKLKATSVTKIR